MKSSYSFHVPAMVMTFILLTGPADAQLVGLWAFDNSAVPGAATIGNDLIVSNANSTIVSVAGIGGGDGAFSVGIGDYFSCNHDIPANGGGDYVNEYTLVYDVYLPYSTDGFYRSLLQTSDDNSNDGDYWLSELNRVGVAAIGYSSDTVTAGTWYRIVFSADIGNTPSFRTTVTDTSGTSWSFDHLDQGVDGRHSLYPVDNQNIVHFFADEDGEDNEIHVSNLGLFDTPLSPYQVSNLGVPGDPIAYVPNPVLEIKINRENGTITLNNPNIGQAQEIKAYSILSPAGALIEANYTPLADGDSNWVQFTAPGATGDLSEGHLTTDSIADGATVMLDDGINGAWLQYYDEDDISFEYLDGNGDLIEGDITFIGATQTTPFDFIDLNFDGVIDGLDWNVYIAGLRVDLTGLSVAQAYRKGDLNGDLINNHTDFLIFKDSYEMANGTGSFARMLAGVPEPSSLLILSITGLAISILGRWCRAMSAVPGIFACIMILAGQADAQLVGLWEFDNPAAPGAATIGNDLIVNNTNSTIAPVAGIGGGDGAFSVGIGDYFTCNHDIPINGGGVEYVNEFTIVYDLYLPLATDAVYRSLLQTSADNSNDGDYWLSMTNRIGVAEIDYSNDTVAADAWYRIVFSADIGNTPSFRTTVTDAAGASWSFDHLDQAIDGRHSLYPIDNQNIVHFFADNDGEDNEIHVSNLALFDTPLSPDQANDLGGPGDPIAFVPDPLLSINVNKTTGNITIVNESGRDMPSPINYYEILSGDGIGGDGLLSTSNWQSLSDQNLDPVDGGNDPGETWDEGGGSGSDLLTEAFLLGGTQFNHGDSVNLGNVYTGGNNGAENLTFNFGYPDGRLMEGVVHYFTGPAEDADFDGDGDVDGADFLSWQTGFGTTGATHAQGDANGDGEVNGLDLTIWKSQFGTGGAAGTMTATVPEPAAFGLLMLALVGLIIHSSFRNP